MTAALSAGIADQIEELVSGPGGGEERAGERRGRGDGVGFLYSSDLHAGVRGFYHDGDAERLECVLDAVAYLDGKPFLYLKTSSECFHDSGDLAQAGDLAVGNVSDVCFPDERQHVMFAH